MPKYRVQRHAVTQPPNQFHKLIPLTQGKNATIDAGDYAWLNRLNWCARYDKQTNSFYAVCERTSMHRMILGCQPNEEGDHINHDTLDNRRENLRKATRAQNGQNRRKQSNNKSGFRGVSFKKSAGKWYARIVVNNREKFLGAFDSPEIAARAYDDAAKNFHGEFAQPNFPNV